jgi:hypothetical protein
MRNSANVNSLASSHFLFVSIYCVNIVIHVLSFLTIFVRSVESEKITRCSLSRWKAAFQRTGLGNAFRIEIISNMHHMLISMCTRGTFLFHHFLSWPLVGRHLCLCIWKGILLIVICLHTSTFMLIPYYATWLCHNKIFVDFRGRMCFVDDFRGDCLKMAQDESWQSLES